MKNKFIKNLKFKSGFTLVETLVAIAILSAAIAGPLVLSIKNIGTANTSQDQLVAFYLGQEVIEYVRNVRDTNLIEKSLDGGVVFNWLKGLEDCIKNDCYIDVAKESDDERVKACLGACPALTLDKSTGVSGVYSYDPSGDKTPFTRTVKITKIDPTDDGSENYDEAKVEVEMTWKSKYGYGKDKLKTMKLQDHIFNWRE